MNNEFENEAEQAYYEAFACSQHKATCTIMNSFAEWQSQFPNYQASNRMLENCLTTLVCNFLTVAVQKQEYINICLQNISHLLSELAKDNAVSEIMSQTDNTDNPEVH